MTIHSATSENPTRRVQGAPDQREYPVREYIGAMAAELAQMARWDGDDTLGQLLDAVAARAAEVP